MLAIEADAEHKTKGIAAILVLVTFAIVVTLRAVAAMLHSGPNPTEKLSAAALMGWATTVPPGYRREIINNYLE